MNTVDILIYICEKREEFVVNGLNAQDALAKATHAIANEYHICPASITKLVPYHETVLNPFILKHIDQKKNELE